MLTFNRRRFIAAAGAGAVAGLLHPSWAQTPAGPFTLPPLGYPADALEPHIDATTMQIHHDRHHAASVLACYPRNPLSNPICSANGFSLLRARWKGSRAMMPATYPASFGYFISSMGKPRYR
jgi:Iron/manganese superoxide dismutases, alpha-hairpin domain